jgi:two-component system response regulator (stage 0 sporulation protein F)
MKGGNLMRTVLIVDDEENIRALYKEELADEGYDVILASNGYEALEVLNSRKPDAIILDIKMPGMDGVTLLKLIKERKDDDIPVIICSAYEEYKQDFSLWASEEYIVKSSDLTKMKSALHRILKE